MAGYSEFQIGGLLIAPFVRQVGLALVIMIVARFLLQRLPMRRFFANPSLAELCIFIVLLAALTAA